MKKFDFKKTPGFSRERAKKEDLIVICDDWFSDRSGPLALRTFVLELIKSNYRIYLLAPRKEYFRENSRKHNIKTQEGLFVHTFYNPDVKATNKIKRTINESILSITVFFAILRLRRKNPINKIVFYSPSIFIGVSIYFLRKIFPFKTYNITRDIFPNWAVDTGIIKETSLINRYFKFAQKYNLKSSDLIGVMSKSSIDIIADLKIIDNEKIKILPNWIDYNHINGFSPNYTFRKEYGLEDKIVLFYAGNFGLAQNLDALFLLAKNLINHENIQFLFFGNGDKLNYVINNCDKISNCRYLGYLEEKNYFEIAKTLDIGLFSLQKNIKLSNYPGKCLGYMAMSKPFIGLFNENNDFKYEMERGKFGLSSEYENQWLESLTDRTIKLINDREMRLRMGLNGYNYGMKHFNVNSVSNNFINQIKNL